MYKVETEDLKDLQKCVKIINEYNAFDYQIINDALDTYANFRVYYNEDNPNNGSDLLKYEIGREGSPVIYIRLYVGLNMNEPKYKQGKEIRVMTNEEFEKNMRALAGITEADEFNITKEFSELVYRLWWD